MRMSFTMSSLRAKVIKLNPLCLIKEIDVLCPADVLLPLHWPKRSTLKQLFISYLDIFSVPRRSFFEWLSYFTTSEMETEKLREFCTAEGQEDMYSYANRPRRTIYEVLAEFKSAQIPLNYIADIFPEIRPRQFSIASSSKVDCCSTI